VGCSHRAVPGGIAGLAALLEEHCEAVEADLLAIGVDLGDLFRPGGRLSWRRLGVLVGHLPAQSATKTAMRDELGETGLAELVRAPRSGHGPWSHAELLLAGVWDSVERLIYVQYQRAGAKGLKPPQPLPRPGVASNVRAINPAARAYLEGVRARNAAAAERGGG
jgi:hypothetical protein